MRRCADTFLLLCLLALPGAAPAQPGKAAAVEELASIWVSACLDGRLRLADGRIREVSPDGIEAYWEPERRQKNARYFRVNEPKQAGLVITDYDPPTRDGFKSTCELISHTRDLKAGWRLVYKAVTGRSSRLIPGLDVYTIDNPAEGYRIEVRRWFLSVGHYTDKIVHTARAGARKPTVRAYDSPFE